MADSLPWGAFSFIFRLKRKILSVSRIEVNRLVPGTGIFGRAEFQQTLEEEDMA
ncbi:MAG: hypothetical protein PUG16_04310 [Lachnospiraceae bacterium]|nr:hypothetical protein [Lachnospiraceae bacterium]